MAFIKLTLDNPLRNCVISGDPESDETPLFDFTEDSVVFEDLKEHGLFTYPEHMITSINRILIQAALLVYSRRFDLIRVQPPFRSFMRCCCWNSGETLNSPVVPRS